MADSPQKAAVESDPTQGLLGGETFNNLKSQWDTFLGAPGGRAALLSAGISLMQPPSFADTGASQIGRAIGTAGETVSRNEAMDLKTAEAESKMNARDAAQSARGASQDIAAQNLEIKRMGVQSQVELRRAQTAAIPIKAEATRLRAEAASLAATEGSADRKAALELRARQLDQQADRDVAAAEARAQQADIAERTLQQRGQHYGTTEALRLQEINRKAAETAQIFGGQPKTLTLEELRAQGGGSSAAPAATTSSGIVTVQTPADAAKLAPGTPYRTPDGRTFTR